MEVIPCQLWGSPPRRRAVTHLAHGNVAEALCGKSDYPEAAILWEAQATWGVLEGEVPSTETERGGGREETRRKGWRQIDSEWSTMASDR